MSRKPLWIAGAAMVVVVVAAIVAYATYRPTLHGGRIDPIRAPEIRLRDFNGRDFTLSSLQGQVVLLYFGYTNCPDQCPLTMAHLKLAMEALGAKAAQAKVVMITTDPARDTPEAMKDFLGNFRPDFIGLVGSPQDLEQVWRDYFVTVDNGGEIHSNFIYVIDRAGYWRETFLPDSSPADEAADIALLLSQ